MTRSHYVPTWIVLQCDDDTYRFLEGDETAWISSAQAGHCTGTRPSSSSKTTRGDGHIHLRNAGKYQQERPYHKTISFIFSTSIFEEWHNQGPYSNNVCNHVGQRWHGQTVSYDGLTQSWTRSHPVSSFCSFQTIHNKLSQWERVKAPKDRWSSSLEATLQQAQIECGVFNELFLVPTSQVACESLCKRMRTSMKRHYSSIGPSSIQNFAQNCSLQCWVGTKPVQYGNANTSERGPLPCPYHDPDLRTAFFELDALSPMTPHPTKCASKNAGVHSIQDDRLKHSTNKPVHTYTWLHEARRYQPAPRPGTMPRQCLPGYQSA